MWSRADLHFDQSSVDQSLRIATNYHRHRFDVLLVSEPNTFDPCVL